MNDLIQYRISVGKFASIAYKASKCSKAKLSNRKVKITPQYRSKTMISNLPEAGGFHRGQRSFRRLVIVAVLCLLLLQSRFLHMEYHNHSETYGYQHSGVNLPHSNVNNGFYIPDHLQNRRFNNNHFKHSISSRYLSNNISALPMCFRDNLSNCNVRNRENVTYHNGTSSYCFCNNSEFGRQLHSEIVFEHYHSYHLANGYRPLLIHSSLQSYPMACSCLLGNKGMHSYNGNPTSGNSNQHQNDKRPDFMLANVEAWRKEDIYITTSVRAVKDRITSHSCVCVIGVPGTGKSTALHHAALSLEREGFIIYIISNSKEFRKYYDRSKKQVFVLDNAFGVYSVNKDVVKSWLKHNESVQNALGKDTKLLVSVRTTIYLYDSIRYRDISFLEESHCINFSDADYKLGIDEMRGMLRHIMTTNGIDVDNIDNMIRRLWPYSEKDLEKMTEEARQFHTSQHTAGTEFAECFPLLCKVLVKADEIRTNPNAFFKDPFPALEKVFRNIKLNNRFQYCALVLCAVFDGNLYEDLLSSICEVKGELDENDTELRNVIMASFNLEVRNHLGRIKEAFKSLNGVFISKVGTNYIMSHTLFHDIVTYSYDDPSFVFTYGRSEFIRNRVRINRDTQQHDPFIIVYNDDKNIERLADRLFRDLKCDHEIGAKSIATNFDIDDERLISYLRVHLSDREQTDKEMIDELFKQCMKTVWWNFQRYEYGNEPLHKLIKSCIQLGTDCNIDSGGGLYPLHIIVPTGNVQLTRLLLANGADKRRIGWQERSVIHRFCTYTNCNKLEMIKLLCQHGKDPSVVKFITNDRHEMLQTLELEDDNLQLEEVLSDYSIRVLTTDKLRIKDYVECYDGKIQLVKRVHDDILTCRGKLGTNILHCSVDDIDVTRYLLDLPNLQQVINQQDNKGRTPYWYIVNKKHPLRGDVTVSDKDREKMIQLYEENKGGLVEIIYSRTPFRY